MTFRGLASGAAVGLALLLVGCGGGSGRSGTDLAVTGVGPSAQVNGGDPAVFVMTVSNQGDYTAEDVSIRNTTLQLSPAALLITCTASDGASCPAQTGPQMTVSSLPAGGRLVFQISSTANLGASGLVSNSMAVSAGTADTNTGNNSLTVSGGVASNDVGITATPPPGPLLSGPATFAMVVSNAGPNDAHDVVLTTTLSAELALSSAGITCVPSGGAATPVLQADGTLKSALIPASGLLTCSIPVTVAAGTSGFAIVKMASTTLGDARAANNSASASVSATLTNDIGIVGTAPPGPLITGAATFAMLVSNAGPDTATNVALATTVSADLTLARETIVCAPSGGAIAPTLQADGTLLSASMPSGSSLNCSIPVTVAAASSSLAVVGMTATSFGDQRLGNNNATASVNATLTNDVGIAATAPAGPLLTGTATFTTTVTNAGPSAATNVVLSNTLSPNLTLSSSISCAASGGATTPTLQPDGTLLVASIPVGAVLNCNVPVTVAAGISATVFTTMAATALGDVRPGNNSATASVSATLSNNVNVTGTALATSVIGGQTTTFTMVVGNSGPSTAFDVVLSNVLGSADLALSGPIVCTPSGGAAATVLDAGGVLRSPSIPVGGVLTCILPLTVAAGANGTVTSTFTATAAGDQRAVDNAVTVATVAVSSNLGVSQTAASQVAAGSPTTFTARVSNPGPGVASNLQINWTHTGSVDLVFDTPTCTATVGATCPTVLGPTMTVPSLGAGRTLAFTFTVTPSANFRGSIVNTVMVTSDEDQDLSNNTSSATTLAVDLRNGSYTVYAADGRSYNLAIDFDAGQYTMTGNGTTATRSFTKESSGDLVVSGAARLRVGEDLLVGGHDFGGGVNAFIATRNFTTNLGALAGSYNLATRNVDSGGVATSRPGAALISGNTLTICQSETVEVAQVRNCAAASRKDYLNLTVSGNIITGVTSSGESYSFVVASSGGAKLLLSAGAAVDGSLEFRIGLIDSSAGLTYGPPLRGPTTGGDWWAATLVASPTPVFTAVGVSTSETIFLTNISNTGAAPFSVVVGSSALFGSGRIYLMQAYPLVVVVGGAPLFGGSASGFIHLSLP